MRLHAVGLILTLLPAGLAGQNAPSPMEFVPYRAPDLVEASAPDSATADVPLPPIVAGVGGGAVGAALGVAGGMMVAGVSGCIELCEVYPLVGALVGEAVGIPLGVHQATGGRSSLGRDLALSALIGAAGTAIAITVPDAGLGLGILAIGVPLAQLMVVVPAAP